MEVLVVGGTRFFGIPMVEELLGRGHSVTIATRGLTKDFFGNKVKRIKLNLYEQKNAELALKGKEYDVVIDKMGYGSKDVRNILDNVSTNKFLHMSTAGVYELNHFDILEEEFDGKNIELKWCSRGEVDYDTAKRQAEAVLCQKYSSVNWISVRSPFVIGENDYTNRLFFYVDHIINKKKMWVDNMSSRICFAESEDLGKFMSYMIDKDFKGTINACCTGVIEIREIIQYIEKASGCKARIDRYGDPAPYNSISDNSLDLNKSRQEGYVFKNLDDVIYKLLDEYVYILKNGT